MRAGLWLYSRHDEMQDAREMFTEVFTEPCPALSMNLDLQCCTSNLILSGLPPKWMISFGARSYAVERAPCRDEKGT